MSNCEYLGELELDANGNVRVRPVVIAPFPEREHRPVAVPTSVARRISAGELFATAVVGDSMQPVILDNDTLIVSSVRQPHNGDIILLGVSRSDPNYGNICGYVWRYHERRSGTYLTKDNRKYSTHRPVQRHEILGVVIRVVHRQFRDLAENHAAVQRIMALHRACRRRMPMDLGFHRAETLNEFRAVLGIPDSELIAGRLPWGLFRATALSDQTHAGIASGDTLTIEVTPESRVGLAVIVRSHVDEILIGTLQRESLDTSVPGDFYLDIGDRRVAVTQANGRTSLWRSIGVVRRVQGDVDHHHGNRDAVVHVREHVKEDGTIIAAHRRSAPNNTNQKWRANGNSGPKQLCASARLS